MIGESSGTHTSLSLLKDFRQGSLSHIRMVFKLGKTERYIMNAGSVGQPRDGNPGACYAVVDDEKMEIVRVPYDVEAVQRKMRKEGLPILLIERLSSGR